MAPIRRRAITWTNGDYFTDAYESLALTELF